MILVDDHCHLTHEFYKNDLDQVLERARKAGVVAIICSGVNAPTNREVLALAKKYAPLVRCSLGFHPVDAVNKSEGETGLSKQEGMFDLNAELAFIKKNKNYIAAIGEVGLDYHWIKDKVVQDAEKKNFLAAIKLAEEIKKPIIVHTRDAEADAVEMLASSSVKNVVLHCFTGRKSVVKRTIDLGYYFSIPAIIEKLQHFKMIAEMASINQLLSETDGPWLSPTGERNEPANVVYTVRNIAKIKGFNEEEVANNIWLNFQRVFG